MSKQFVMFEECGKSEKLEHASKVMTGEAQIYVMIGDSSAFLLPERTTDYSGSFNDYHERGYYKAPTWRSLLKGCGSGLRPSWGFKHTDPDFLDESEFDQEDYYFEFEEIEFLDEEKFTQWIGKNDLSLNRGMYPLSEQCAKDIALQILNSPYSGDGVEFTIWRMMRICVDGCSKPVARIDVTFSHKGKSLIWPELYESAKAAFFVDSRPKAKDLMARGKRTRSDAVKTAIEAYLSLCDAGGKVAELDECWRFVSEYQSIDVNLDGVLTYPIKGGQDMKTCDRKQLSDRLRRAIKAR